MREEGAKERERERGGRIAGDTCRTKRKNEEDDCRAGRGMREKGGVVFRVRVTAYGFI